MYVETCHMLKQSTGRVTCSRLSVVELVSFAALFWDVTWDERCVTSQKTAAKETPAIVEQAKKKTKEEKGERE